MYIYFIFTKILLHRNVKRKLIQYSQNIVSSLTKTSFFQNAAHSPIAEFSITTLLCDVTKCFCFLLHAIRRNIPISPDAMTKTV